jgi:transposase
MPAVPPYIIEPVWEQFEALLPERKTDHPFGCHRPRIPDRVVFEKLVAVLVFGCAYWRIADEGCSATTLRRRRDEWIEMGLMDALEGIALAAYDRIIGLELADVCVDGCITKAPCGGQKAGKSPVDRGKQGIKRSTMVDAKGIPLGVLSAPAKAATIRRFFLPPWRLSPICPSTQESISIRPTTRSSPADFWRRGVWWA